MNKKLAMKLANALMGKDRESIAKGVFRQTWVDDLGGDGNELLAEWLQDWFENNDTKKKSMTIDELMAVSQNNEIPDGPLVRED